MKVSSAIMSSLSYSDTTIDVTEGYDGCADLHILFRDGMSIINYVDDEGERISHALPTADAYLTYSKKENPVKN